ncbi:hypothetical protein ACH42_16340 [Endozoicomonas sp. (ex Bugula neritina AB1)]|nr:hypothetical protein ACH42_16340 [Endozoicomonas sp. (ex Bugula neritina AB1)]
MKSSHSLRKKWLDSTGLIKALGLFLALLLPPQSWGQWQDPDLTAVLARTLNTPSSFSDRFEAEVWLTDMSSRLTGFIKEPNRRIQLLKLIHREATKVELQPELVLAVIQTESTFDRFAVSSAGAQGLMQIMPFWKDIIGRSNDNLTHIETNLRYGCTILSYYIEKENGNISRALARYNGSLGKTWYPERVMRNWEKNWLVE